MYQCVSIWRSVHSGTWRGSLEPVELEFHSVNYEMPDGTGKWTWSSERAVSTLNHWAISPASELFNLKWAFDKNVILGSRKMAQGPIVHIAPTGNLSSVPSMHNDRFLLPGYFTFFPLSLNLLLPWPTSMVNLPSFCLTILIVKCSNYEKIFSYKSEKQIF